MPDKPLTVLTYAASASLAAVALIYFFNPNYIIDGESNSAGLSRRARTNSVVGLYNPANDCFINSVLQALAGLGDLRIYLIRELHRRSLDRDGEVYKLIERARRKDGKPIDMQKARSLLDAEVTRGLKDMLDRLNERPLQKKVITAAPFVAVLESAFATTINRNQQDAQELLQIVAERMADEYNAGRAARKRAREDAIEVMKDSESKEEEREQALASNQDERAVVNGVAGGVGDGEQVTASAPTTMDNGRDTVGDAGQRGEDLPEEDGFPLEGQTQSQIECQHCHFIPKSPPSSFIMLTLSVPARSASTLNECFDGAFKTEHIDDYRCDRCRLVHAAECYERSIRKAKSQEQQDNLKSDLERLKRAIENDPENPPNDILLPDSKTAPTRRIAKSLSITSFPKILVVHLSRSAFDRGSYSSKNNAKVVFPERLPLGSLLNRRNYRLLGVVTHKGTHHSGHYETFRRQHIYPPSSTPHIDREKGPYARSLTPTPQALSRQEAAPTSQQQDIRADSDLESDMGGTSRPTSPAARARPREISRLMPETPSTVDSRRASTASPPRDSVSTVPTTPASFLAKEYIRSDTPSSLDVADGSTMTSQQTRTSSRQRVRERIEEVKERKKRERRLAAAQKDSQRWWRISDDRVRECKTSDVLGMQREVYMLFYEMIK